MKRPRDFTNKIMREVEEMRCKPSIRWDVITDMLNRKYGHGWQYGSVAKAYSRWRKERAQNAA